MFISKEDLSELRTKILLLEGWIKELKGDMEAVPTIHMKSPEWKKDHFRIGAGPAREIDVPASKVLQLIVDHFDLRYVEEGVAVTKTKPPKLVKAKREKRS